MFGLFADRLSDQLSWPLRSFGLKKLTPLTHFIHFRSTMTTHLQKVRTSLSFCPFLEKSATPNAVSGFPNRTPQKVNLQWSLVVLLWCLMSWARVLKNGRKLMVFEDSSKTHQPASLEQPQTSNAFCLVVLGGAVVHRPSSQDPAAQWPGPAECA